VPRGKIPSPRPSPEARTGGGTPISDDRLILSCTWLLYLQYLPYLTLPTLPFCPPYPATSTSGVAPCLCLTFPLE
jgi:hypothetical protein